MFDTTCKIDVEMLSSKYLDFIHILDSLVAWSLSLHHNNSNCGTEDLKIHLSSKFVSGFCYKNN